MPAPILFSAGGDVLQKYGTLVRRVRPPALGGEGLKEVFSRVGGTIALGRDGVYRNVGANVPRIDWLLDPLTGQKAAFWVLEQAATNRLLQSQTLATGPWAGNGHSSATNAAVTAPDGTLTGCTLQDDATNNTHYWNQSITITAGEWIAASCYLKAGTRSKVLWDIVDPGTTTGVSVQVNLANGTLGSVVTLGTATIGVQPTITALTDLLGNPTGWYYLRTALKIDSGTSVSGNMFFYLCDNAYNATYLGDGTSVVSAWGCQLERNGTSASGDIPPTGYVPTTTGVATRNIDVCTLPCFTTPAPGQWIYLRFLERGQAYQSLGVPRLFELGGAGANTPPYLYVVNNSQYSARWNPAGTQYAATPGGAQATDGQVVEFLHALTPTQVVGQVRVQGGALNATAAAFGADGFPVFTDRTMYLARTGLCALSRVVMGSDFGVPGGVSSLVDAAGVPY